MSERGLDWFWPCIVLGLIAVLYFDHQDTAEKEQTKRTIVTSCAVEKPDLCIASMMDKLSE